MRPATACESCRYHRRKCRLASSDRTCLRCDNLNLKCSLLDNAVYRAPSRHAVLSANLRPLQQKSNLPVLSPGELVIEGDLLPPYTIRRELVLLYFQHIHDKHHSLFHQPSVEFELENGQVPDVLLYAMMSLGARFSNSAMFAHVEPRYRGSEFVQKAKGLLDMADISITTVQACVLLGTISFSESKTESEALYYALANRLACILRLPHQPVSDEVERQVTLRIYWTLYMIDIWSSTGLQLPRQMSRSDDIVFPMAESGFLTLSKHSVQSDSTYSSIWAEMVHLAHIWVEIHDLNKATVEGSMQPESLDCAVEVLSGKLNNWSASLQPHLKPTIENLERYASLGLGSALAALHLGFHYYNEVLFYRFLAEDADHSSVTATIYKEKCKSHATYFCDLLYTCSKIPGCECFYIMVGHMVVIASTVYIHTLVSSTIEEQITTARKRLERNFEILTHLQSYWIKLDDTLLRLKAFHEACTSSVESSFCMDRWMLSFILEHGTQAYKKVEHDALYKNLSNFHRE